MDTHSQNPHLKPDNTHSFFNSLRNCKYARTQQRVLGGVCGSLSRAWNIDIALIRALVIIACLFLPMALAIYAVFWVILPEENTGLILLEELFNGRPKGAFFLAVLLFLLSLGDGVLIFPVFKFFWHPFFGSINYSGDVSVYTFLLLFALYISWLIWMGNEIIQSRWRNLSWIFFGTLGSVFCFCFMLGFSSIIIEDLRSMALSIITMLAWIFFISLPLTIVVLLIVYFFARLRNNTKEPLTQPIYPIPAQNKSTQDSFSQSKFGQENTNNMYSNLHAENPDNVTRSEDTTNNDSTNNDSANNDTTKAYDAKKEDFIVDNINENTNSAKEKSFDNENIATSDAETVQTPPVSNAEGFGFNTQVPQNSAPGFVPQNNPIMQGHYAHQSYNDFASPAAYWGSSGAQGNTPNPSYVNQPIQAKPYDGPTKVHNYALGGGILLIIAIFGLINNLYYHQLSFSSSLVFIGAIGILFAICLALLAIRGRRGSWITAVSAVYTVLFIIPSLIFVSFIPLINNISGYNKTLDQYFSSSYLTSNENRSVFAGDITLDMKANSNFVPSKNGQTLTVGFGNISIYLLRDQPVKINIYPSKYANTLSVTSSGKWYGEGLEADKDYAVFKSGKSSPIDSSFFTENGEFLQQYTSEINLTKSSRNFTRHNGNTVKQKDKLTISNVPDDRQAHVINMEVQAGSIDIVEYSDKNYWEGFIFPDGHFFVERWHDPLTGWHDPNISMMPGLESRTLLPNDLWRGKPAQQWLDEYQELKIRRYTLSQVKAGALGPWKDADGDGFNDLMDAWDQEMLNRHKEFHPKNHNFDNHKGNQS